MSEYFFPLSPALRGKRVSRGSRGGVLSVLMAVHLLWNLPWQNFSLGTRLNFQTAKTNGCSTLSVENKFKAHMPEAFPRVLSRAAAQQGCRSERSGWRWSFPRMSGSWFLGIFSGFFSVLYEKIFIVVHPNTNAEKLWHLFFPYTFFFFFGLDRDKGPCVHWEEACTCALQGCCNGVRNKAWTCASHRLVTALYVYLPVHIIYRDNICILIMHISTICITLVVRTGRASPSVAVVSVAATRSPRSYFRSAPWLWFFCFVFFINTR